MEDLNTKRMFKNKKWAQKLQKNKPIQTSKHAKNTNPQGMEKHSYKSTDSTHPQKHATNADIKITT